MTACLLNGLAAGCGVTALNPIARLAPPRSLPWFRWIMSLHCQKTWRRRSLAPAGVDHIVEVAFGANVDTDVELLKMGGSIAAYATDNATPKIPFWQMVFKNIRVFFLGSDDFPTEAKIAATRDLNDALQAGFTGRHGIFSSYEAFAQIVDSMATQHAKWLEQCRELPWRKPIASLHVFLTGHAWRNDHNGFSHQTPGFVANALARRSEIIRIYYPPDWNCLLSVMDHCLRSRNYVNVVTCGKQPELQWLNMDEAVAHCTIHSFFSL